MFRTIGFIIVLFLFSFASLYEEFIKKQIKELPLDKAIIAGKGNKELIIFVNPDCFHCRKEWKTLRKHLDRLKLYVFVIPFKAWGEENLKKVYYVVCSQNPAKALDEALTGQLDDKSLNPEKCKKLEYHLKAAEMVGLQVVPLNILPKEGKIIEGASPKVFEYLGIKTHLE